MSVRIELTQNKYALIDNEDHPLVIQYKWCALRIGRKWYAMTGASKETKYKTILMHRLIMNAQPGQEIDHKEHYEDYVDNRKNNLRFCTNTQNQGNKRKQLTHAGKKTSSQYKGVSWNKRAGKWRMGIKGTHLGYFTSEIEAAEAYNAAAIEHFGEFAKLNEI